MRQQKYLETDQQISQSFSIHIIRKITKTLFLGIKRFIFVFAASIKIVSKREII